MPKIPLWVFLLLSVLLISAGFIDIMDIDAAQYAEISRGMMHSTNWLQVYEHGHDYLDKPPFLFWVSAMSMKVFGVGNFGYKFPSILFAIWSMYATYRLTKLLYDDNTARVAALILGTCQGMFLMTNDVRTDTILMSWVITAIWMIKEADIKRRWWNVLGGTASIAFGMMTKGPIAIMVPMFCFGSEWVLKRQWKKLFNPYHLFDACLILLFLIPMCIGLYQQYDLHPEKIMDGKTGTSGLKFFFWTQSFGRITGENIWDNGADISFLLVNMLWSFLPWIFLFLPALVVNVMELVKQRLKLKPNQEFITTGGFIITYLALGLSHYQLPHYIFVVFPLAAIMTAKLLKDFLDDGKYPKLYRILKPVMITVGGLLFVGLFLIITITFPAAWPIVVGWGVCLGSWLCCLFKRQFNAKIFWLPAISIMLINVFLTHYFYKNLLHYQVGTQVGRYIYKHDIPAKTVMTYDVHDPLTGIHFYAQRYVPVYQKATPERKIDTFIRANIGDYILTGADGIVDLGKKGYSFDTVFKGVFFKVSELTPDFLNHNTRYKATQPYYFINIK